jgi:DNA-binding NarL/FixJ family response regulator
MSQHHTSRGSIAETASIQQKRSRVLLVDDHPLLRMGLRTVLGKDSRLHVVAECEDARSALACLRAENVDVIILDITLRGGSDGLELIKSAISEHPRMRILVLSAHDENLYAMRALAAGALGYVMKGISPEALRTAIHAVLAGQIVISTHLEKCLVQHAVSGSNRTDPAAPLSDRELEILLRIGRGQSSCEIGAALGIALKTVETHRANMRRKLLLKTGAELLRYAVAWSHAEEHGHSSRDRGSPRQPALEKHLEEIQKRQAKLTHDVFAGIHLQ